MKKNFLTDLTEFFDAARHLWGRCPHCKELFRMSDAAISYGSQPPRDWLRRLQKQRELLDRRQAEVDEFTNELAAREDELILHEHAVRDRERTIHGQVRKLALEYLKSESRVRQLVRESSKSAVLKSRATLLGKLFERLAPFFQKFNHDPRDIRPIMEPIDYICFDGLTVERQVSRITFVEVKAGTSKVTKPEQSILKAVREQRVFTEVWNFGSKSLPLEQQLQ